MEPIDCFMLEETTLFRESLRRYGGDGCRGGGCHDALIVINPAVDKAGCEHGGSSADDFPHNDPRWPVQCEDCDYVFTDNDQWQHSFHRLYSGNGMTCTLRDAPVGSMYYADWMWHKGPDGHSLAVVLPPDRHVWLVDSQASNCTMPQDTEHRCWCRHGVPPMITVDKSGLTCAAGAGSIQTKTWHGFLRNGQLVS